MAGYYVSAHKDTPEFELWVISFRDRRGSKIAAGSVTLHKHARYVDVRYDDGEPCSVGSLAYMVRRAAVKHFRDLQAQIVGQSH